MIARKASKSLQWNAPASAALIATCALAAATISGCKPNPPQPSTSSPVASTPVTQKRVPVTAPPAVKKHLYPAEADPKVEIASALKEAHRSHKHVILDFGGDWCGDCQVLDIYFHQSPNLELLNNDFVLVHIDIGHFDKNVDVAEKYDVPLQKGVPALAVLDQNGKLLYSQAIGDFADMRYMQPTSVTEFLNRWKA